MIRSLLLLFVGLQAGATAPQDTQPTTLPNATDDVIRQMLERDQQQLVEQHADLPVVRIASIAELTSIRSRQGRLIVGSPIQADRPVRVIAEDHEGVIRFTPHGPIDPTTGQRNFMVLIQQITFNPPGMLYTFVANSHGQVQIARDGQIGEQSFSIQLIHDGPTGADPTLGEHPVRLLVTMHHENDPEQQTRIRLGATDFDALRLEHPQQVQTFLRPILRELKQEREVFAIDPRTAWQVLGQTYEPTDEDVANVRRVLERLDSPDFTEREQATEELTVLDQRAALVLSQMDRSLWSPETVTTIDTFLAGFAKLDPDKAKRLGQNPLFLLDVMHSDDGTLRTLAWRQLTRVLNRPVDFDPQAPEPERTATIERLWQELARTDAIATQPAAR